MQKVILSEGGSLFAKDLHFVQNDSIGIPDQVGYEVRGG